MTIEPSVAAPRVLLELGPVCRLTLHRPALGNALDYRTGEEFELALSRIAELDEARVLVLSGSGNHFCTGGDFAFIEENTWLESAEVERRMLRFYGMFLGLLALPVPTLAVVHGSAVGAGLCLALGCDVRLGSVSSRLAANFVRLGLHPGMGASALLPALVGTARGTELLLTGASVGGEQAAALGLLSRAVPDAELTTEAEQLARDLASAPPLAMRQTVATLRAPLRTQVEAALGREAACQAANFASEELRASVLRFKQKQRPEQKP